MGSKKPLMKTLGVDLSINLASYFKFDGDMVDSIDSQAPTTNVGTTYSTGVVNDSRVFNGSTEYAKYAGNSKLNMAVSDGVDRSFSVSVWVKTASGGDSNGRVLNVAIHSPGTYQWSIQAYNTSALLQLFSQSDATSGTEHKSCGIGAMTIGVWNHFVATYNGSIVGGMKTYLNGVDTGVFATVTGAYTGMRSITPDFAIGRRTNLNAARFKGELDELAIWKDRVLTAREALKLYQLGINGNSII
jgi:Concanavalin A-like lectin/glucanases superfamily